jgi:hypothetical protein
VGLARPMLTYQVSSSEVIIILTLPPHSCGMIWVGGGKKQGVKHDEACFTGRQASQAAEPAMHSRPSS